MTLFLAVLLWILIVPVQVYGPVQFGGFGYLTLLEMVVLAVLLLPMPEAAHRPGLAP